MRFKLIAMAIALTGCTTLQGEVSFDFDAAPPPLEAGSDAGTDEAGSECDLGGRLLQRGARAFVLKGDQPNTAVVFSRFASSIQSGNKTEVLSIDVYAVGDPKELLSHISQFGDGGSANLSTCTQCMLVQRGCDAMGTHCSGPFYYPSSGRAVVSRMSADAGQPFQIDMTDVVLSPVSIDDAGLIKRDPSTPCVLLQHVIITSPATETWIAGCSNGWQCAMAKTASSRHPD